MTQQHTTRPVWVLKCDECGAEAQMSYDRPDLKLARATGWQCSDGCPVVDLCPKCVPEKVAAKYPTELYPGCPCYRCDSPSWPTITFRDGEEHAVGRMTLCPMCGSKRCPGAMDHTQHPKES
ncbi:hypothetical protein E3_0470 [Rhodococcus phage E3]|uniref:hypothetical protein n=1 Tax=Rhodococcus phage E3 TaxID=1007869 RepID=UPI0002C6CC50|nr:hypothetical protein M176_gp050 [Rhodococcus phage E3]AEQ20960.1 hypothetical protein E3_0470 [Rhodococcus phage E3]